MRQIQLTEQAYDQAKIRADQAGFPSVDEYLSSMLVDAGYEMTEIPNLDYLFTSERLAIIDKSIEDVKAGAKTYSMEEVREHLAQTRSNWMRENEV
jgi:hypothetical protein